MLHLEAAEIPGYETARAQGKLLLDVAEIVETHGEAANGISSAESWRLDGRV